MTTFFPDAFVVLTGGHGERLGRVDKAMLMLGGRTLLQRALASADGRQVVLVGPHRTPDSGVTTTTELPPGGGPAAGVAAGMARLAGNAAKAPISLIGILAIDQVGVTEHTWRRLTAALVGRNASGAVLIEDGRRQYGVGVYNSSALAAVIAERTSWHGVSLRALLDPLIGVEVAAALAEARDIDTPADLAWWQRREDEPT